MLTNEEGTIGSRIRFFDLDWTGSGSEASLTSECLPTIRRVAGSDEGLGRTVDEVWVYLRMVGDKLLVLLDARLAENHYFLGCCFRLRCQLWILHLYVAP